jgi:hypothetical protein
LAVRCSPRSCPSRRFICAPSISSLPVMRRPTACSPRGESPYSLWMRSTAATIFPSCERSQGIAHHVTPRIRDDHEAEIRRQIGLIQGLYHYTPARSVRRSRPASIPLVGPSGLRNRSFPSPQWRKPSPENGAVPGGMRGLTRNQKVRRFFLLHGGPTRSLSRRFLVPSA